jgi:NAD(P)-dependent dehydrogenase (short-subunit alcohol dehydrogenase family)
MMGAHLAITGRDRGRTEDAAAELRAAGGGQVAVFVADLSSQSEVRRLADEVLQRLSRIDVLVNNVGGYWNTRHVTADGLERTFALNHLASFLLTHHVNPPGFRSRSRAVDGPLLRQQRPQEILQAQLRRGRCGAALAGERADLVGLTAPAPTS